MLKGEIGLKTIFGLVLGMMVLGTLGAAVTTGSLGDVIRQGFTDVGHFTDYTTEIDASDEQDGKESFSDLAMFVRDRSVDCNRVDARNSGIPIGETTGQPYSNDGAQDDPINDDIEGYPGLEGTRLGIRPVCTGGSSTFIRDRWDWVPGRGMLGGGPEDNVMPGSLSRENFEITEGNLHFEQPEYGEYSQADVWLENNIAAVSGQTPEEHINPEFVLCSDREHDYGYCDLNRNEEDVYDGTGRNFVVFFEEPGIAEQRTQENELLSDWGYGDRVWRADGNEQTDEGFWEEDQDLKEFQHELQLCEGDEGYIQINRDVPMNTGTADTTSAENYYPMIVVTDTEQSGCGDDLGQNKEYSGPTEANQLFIKTGSGSGDDYDWPHADNFEFKQWNHRQGANWVRPYTDINEDGSACEIYYHERDWGAHTKDGATLKTYEIGTRVNRGAGSFREEHGLFYEDKAHRIEERRLNQDIERDAVGLLDEIYDSGGLDGSDLADADGAGDLRPKTANYGENELHGDLVCAEDESSDRAQWRLCHENLNDNLRSINTEHGEYTCTPDSGVWHEGVGP